jgi:hypothetical protein
MTSSIARNQGIVQVISTDDRPTWGILRGPRLGEEPVDRARAVENAKSAFPTSSLDAKNASTRSTGVLMVFDEEEKERKMTRSAS